MTDKPLSYFEYFDLHFRNMSYTDRFPLFIPIISILFWISYGVVFPNIIMPVDYIFYILRFKGNNIK